MGALDHAVRQGKARYAGISSYSAEETRAAAKILRELGTPCLIHQPKYSLLNRDPETTGLLDTLEDEGIGCIAFCPLAQGLLTGRYLNGVPEDSRAAKSYGFLTRDHVTPERIKQIQELNSVAKQRGQSLAQMALAWVLRGGRVTSALIGASRVAQIEENVKALANREFSDDELRMIDESVR